MTRLIATLIALTTLGAAAAPPKVALVRITDLYRDLPSTKTEISGFDAQREDIMKDRRAEELRKLVEELKSLQADIQKEGSASDPGRQKLLKDYETKVAAMKSLQQEFENFKNERTLEINREMVKTMRASFERITKEARAVAEKKGFDWLIDSSGNTNTGLPVVLYSKNAPDLTAEVLAALNTSTTGTPSSEAAAPQTPPATPTPKPAAKPAR
ncbi:OmpH family outer membrane protein [Luteolibacter ambystomatis]|uniref:OmpH family outer membrane protein n=1 Tax=Luteolibacter ambystomatis TaxID=2824561 RepID=A0A975G7C8_9BACT|nr:OmpH family outer membrane protein [Luteolibacter ambystomatis]QUE50153.1 OmpH family outer membrane protein [Luteolibacter ambystomatis]